MKGRLYMNKYLVTVNNKYLISVEANTHGGAEHRILDLCPYEGAISCCQAFSKKDLRTDTFAAMAKDCETISFKEFISIVNRYEENLKKLKGIVVELEQLHKEKKFLQESIKTKELTIAAKETEYKFAYDSLNGIF